ncbi:recombinase family protein [Micromonospora sp. NBC_01813]|uniref:recombinase family protein n=1 Tax=Micromonospora sp. NBC_01813 TaxID=2975988 RepID=UPI002DDC751D|nr:recombinase family protein [Micromonospora sp. NBC_01813]WSA10259.1 recombinase family protein [Micromonospora sp. NBC_01813]
MGGTASVNQPDFLTGWLHSAQPQSRIRGQRPPPAVGLLRFAFYGRISTAEYQDATSSRAWQLDSANRTIADHGEIVSEYFDIGCSRRLPWHARPQAAALFTAVTQPRRVFDAVIIGEFERAFDADQLAGVAAVLAARGVQLWLPETRGPVDLNDPTHQALVMLLGHQSKREVLRARFRTTMAMRAQVREQGRHLGGRPPYGYRLVDAGPHPNTAHARWGRRLHRLAPDPVTAPHVQWIFAQRIVGTSAAGIARTLNHLGVPSPSRYDRSRNRHRTAEGWTVRTVAELLANPRYTGRQVWNRQYTDHQETEPGDRRTSRGSVRRWNPRDQWVLSTRLVHPPLVSETDFIKAQTVNAVATPEDGLPRRYLLTGLVICRTCGRRADAHWVRGRPGYRCRHGHSSASPPYPAGPSRCTYAKTCSSPTSHGNSTIERRKPATTRELSPRTYGQTRSPSPATPTPSQSAGSR